MENEFNYFFALKLEDFIKNINAPKKNICLLRKICLIFYSILITFKFKFRLKVDNQD